VSHTYRRIHVDEGLDYVRATRLLSGAASLASAAFLLVVAPTAASAAVPSPPAVQSTNSATTDETPNWASFEGKQFNIKAGWGEATDCFVFQRKTECFRTPQQAAAREKDLGLETPQSATQSVVTPQAACASPLELWANGGFSGRHLVFYDGGYWQNMNDWDFNNQMSSFKTHACGAWLADNTNGSQPWYPGTGFTSMVVPNQSIGVLAAGWNDRVGAIWINN